MGIPYLAVYHNDTWYLCYAVADEFGKNVRMMCGRCGRGVLKRMGMNLLDKCQVCGAETFV